MLKVINHPITLLLFTILSIIFFLSLDKTNNKRQQSAHTIAQLENEVTNLQQEVVILENETEKANTSLNKEKIIRNELLMKKPGEYVVQLSEVGFESAETIADKTENVKPLDEWVKLFF